MNRLARLGMFGLSFGLLALPACQSWLHKKSASVYTEPAPQLAPVAEPVKDTQPEPPPPPEIAEAPETPAEVVTVSLPKPTAAERTIEAAKFSERIPPPQATPPELKVEPAPAERHPMVLALEAFLNDRPEDAIQHLNNYDAKDQELLLRLLPIVARVENSEPSSQLDGAGRLALLDVLNPLIAEVQTSAPLVLDKLVFCKEVRGYGMYQAMDRGQYRPGDPVMIYAELQNLADRKEGDSFVTRLSGTVEIRDADCHVVWSQGFPNAVSRSQSPRNDHFTHIRFQTPDLPPGFYTLQIRITDLATKRETQRTLSFRVAHMNGAN